MIERENLKVLLVEDSLGDARLISTQLESVDLPHCAVQTTRTLAESIRQVAKEPVDLVLLDLALPDSTGIDTYRSVRRESSTPVIVVTAHEDSAMDAINEGADDSLIKGRFDGDILKRTIRHTMARWQLRQQLLEQQAGFHQIIENHPDGVVVVDANGDVLYANQSAQVLFGVEQDELLGANFGYPLATKSTQITFLQPRPDGSIKITAEFRTLDTTWEGQSAHVVFIRDVSKLVREQALLDRAVKDSSTPLSQRHFSQLPLAESNPEQFGELSLAYDTLLEEALEIRAYKSTKNFEDSLSRFTDQLMECQPGPRDLIAMHTSVMKAKLREASPARAEAYLDEGRLLVLNLMGRLVAYYRPYALAGSPHHQGEM
jgi:CheY-like chemotaxis protein